MFILAKAAAEQNDQTGGRAGGRLRLTGQFPSRQAGSSMKRPELQREIENKAVDGRHVSDPLGSSL